jgi:hypothetical protein
MLGTWLEQSSTPAALYCCSVKSSHTSCLLLCFTQTAGEDATKSICSITQRKRFWKETIKDVRTSRKRCYNEDPSSHLYASHTVRFDRLYYGSLGYPGTTKRAMPRTLIMLHALPLGISYEKVSMTGGVINVKQGYHEP